MNRSTPGLPVHHQLPAQTHVHRVSDAIQPSHPLLAPSPALQADSLPSEPPGKSFLDGMNQKSQTHLYIQPCFTLQFLIS